MNVEVVTTAEIRAGYVGEPGHWMDERVGEEFDRWLAAHDAEVRATERERIIADMEDCSHPDDWNVPCVYVSSYAKRLRKETEKESA